MPKARTVRGTIAVHPRGFGFVTFDDAPLESAFVPPPELNALLAGDRVEAVVEEGEGGRLTATRVTLLARTRTEVFGSVAMHRGKAHLKIDREVANTDWRIEGGVAVREGDFVVAAVGDSAVEPLRTVPAADASLERVVVRHGVRSVFPRAVLNAARETKTPRDAGRRDLRDLPTLTIDAPVSTDLDDALAVMPAREDGAVRLFVSIADVDALVREGSEVDAEARLRGTSVYLAGRVIPMLPSALSEDALSLLEGKDRPALTVEMRIDAEGRTTSTDLYASVIRSHARLAYDDVAAYLDTGEAGPIAPAVLPTLRWLRTAAARIALGRRARGGVSLLRSEAYVTMDEATREPLRVDARVTTSAHALVERLMVAANEAVAVWLAERGLPGVFRVHEEPTPDRVHALAEFAKNFGFEAGFGEALTPRGLAAFEQQFDGSIVAPALYNVLARALGPARYTVHAQPHFGLAAPLYVHFTSPIRRYADLAVHRIVKGYLEGQRDRVAGEAALEELAVHLNAAAYRADKAEAERLRMMAARLFATRLGERFRGNVVQVKPFGLVVQLVGAGVTGTIALDALAGGPFRVDAATHALRGASRTYAIGEAIEVTIAGANEELGRIDLAPAEARA